MAQADNTVTPGVVDRSGKTYWTASMYSNDADTTGNLTVKAAPSAGNLYVEHVVVICDQDCGGWTLNDDTSAILGPIELTATEMAHITDITFKRPIKLTGALKIDTVANAPLNVLAEGFTS